MSTRANPMAGRYFNDPGIAAAVSNLAGAFAPPSPEEYLIAEEVKGARTTNSALADLYSMANGNPDILGGIVGGGWDPTQGFEAMRGGLANERYKTDVTANTTLATNAADNERALREALLTGAMNPAGRQDMDAELLGAILPGINAPGVSAAGPVAPTDAQVRGDLIAGARDDGLISNDDIYAMTMGDVPTQQIVTDAGNRLTFGPLAARDGAEPYNPTGGQAAATPITFARGGVRMGGFITPDGKYVDAAGQQLSLEEAGTAAEVGKPVGTNDELGITTSNVTLAARTDAILAESDMLIDTLAAEIQNQAGAAGIAGTIQNVGQNILQVAQELGTAFGDDPDALITEEMLATLGQEEGPYDPTFARLRAGMLQLAYLNAQRDNPSGEVSRFALERQIEALGQGALANDQSILAALGMNKEANARKRAATKALLGQEVVPPAGQPGATGPVSISTDAEYEALPSGTEFIAPDGTTRRKP